MHGAVYHAPASGSNFDRVLLARAQYPNRFYNQDLVNGSVNTSGKLSLISVAPHKLWEYSFQEHKNAFTSQRDNEEPR